MKPANVLLCHREAGKNLDHNSDAFDMMVKVTDFGFSRDIPQMSTTLSQVGTPLFAAPEVLSGKGRYSVMADIFSFGLTICFMLSTDKELLRRLGDDRGEKVKAIMFLDKWAWKKHSLFKGLLISLDNLSFDLRDILFLCLSREPSGRRPAAELVEMDVFQDVNLRAEELFKAQKAMQSRSPKSRYQECRKAAQCYKSLKMYNKALKMFQDARTEKDSNEQKATDYHDTAECYHAVGNYDRALAKNKESLRIRQAIYGSEEDHRSIAASYSAIATCLQSLGKPKMALEAHEQSLEMRKRVITDTADRHQIIDLRAKNAETLCDMVNCELSSSNKDQALILNDECMHIIPMMKEGKEMALLNRRVGHCFFSLGEFPKSIECFKRSYRVWRRLQSPSTIESYMAKTDLLNFIANCHFHLDQFNETIKYSKANLQLQEDMSKSFDVDPTLSVQLTFNIVACYASLGNNEKADHSFVDCQRQIESMKTSAKQSDSNEHALTLYRQCLEMQRLVLGENHINLASTLNQIGSCLQRFGQFDLALQNHDKSLELQRALPEDRVDRNEIAITQDYRAKCLKAMGRTEEALAIHEKNLEVLKDLSKQDRKYQKSVATTLNNMAGCFQDLGEHHHALKLFKRSKSILKSVYSGNRHHPLINRARENITACLDAWERVTRRSRHLSSLVPAGLSFFRTS